MLLVADDESFPLELAGGAEVEKITDLHAADAQVVEQLSPFSVSRIISDNGPHIIARDFKEFIRLTGLSHVRTSPYYPQSNGRLELFLARWTAIPRLSVIREYRGLFEPESSNWALKPISWQES